MYLHHVSGPVVAFVLVAMAAIRCSGGENAAVRPLSFTAMRGERLTPVSDSFLQEFEAASRSIPDEIWRIVYEAGWRVKLADSVVAAVPALRDASPRGWPAGWTWENTDAVHLPLTRQLVIAEKRRNKKGEVVGCTRVGGVLRHEMGHAFDIIGDRASHFSATPEFLSAYVGDVRQMTAEQQHRLYYYLQRDKAGPQETFAEAFGILLGGGSDPTNRSAFEQSFPQVMSYVRYSIDSARVSEDASDLPAVTLASPAGIPDPGEMLESRGRIRRRVR